MICSANSATVLEVNHEGLDILILDAPACYDRSGGPYLDATGKDYHDNWRRFAAPSLAGAENRRRPDARLAPRRRARARLAGGDDARLHALLPDARTPSILTIHNIAFQGQFSADIFPACAFPRRHSRWKRWNITAISASQGGLKTAASAITTVSPSYAGEILTRSSAWASRVHR